MSEASKAAKRRYYGRNKAALLEKVLEYRKTQSGYLMQKYRNMQNRIEGRNKKSAHLYAGLDLLPREEFYEWANCSPMFRVLFRQFQESGFDLKQAPTVDRKDSNVGYVLDNMEWVTHSVNSSRGARSRHGKAA